MHTYVHCSTVYNSKDLEPTQMSINDRQDKENVAQIHPGILCSHKNRWVHVLCRDMDESGNHHSQQTDTRTENKTLHVLTHRWVLNNENTWTQGREHHTWGLMAGGKGGTAWGAVGRLGRDNMGRNTRRGWWGNGGSKPHCHVCTYATILNDLHMYPRT